MTLAGEHCGSAAQEPLVGSRVWLAVVVDELVLSGKKTVLNRHLLAGELLAGNC